jgi:hypothetical protein
MKNLHTHKSVFVEGLISHPLSQYIIQHYYYYYYYYY